MQPLLRRVLWSGLFLCVLASAQEKAADPQLDSVRKTVLALRDYAKSHPDVKGGIPDVTVAKHQIRDWIEARLTSFPQNGDVAVLSDYFHQGIEKSRLFCDDDDDCLPTALGFLDEIAVNRNREFLTITTAVGVGVWCGYDNSAYVYEWKSGMWQRVWENEQDDYAKDAYHPQALHSIHISDPAEDGSRLILTLGSRTGCLAAFKSFYYRLWRTGTPNPLLDKSETLNDEGEPPVIGTLTKNDFLIEFSAGGTGYGFPHKALRRYEVKGSSVIQTDPIAPTARDFVEEWLDASWDQSAARADSPTLREWHQKLHRDDGQGDYTEPALGCANDPSLVEITTHLEASPKHYFLVRAKQPLHFTMVNIGDQPFADCTKPAPEADRQPSLIPANQ
jgi:hypothetical protein